MFSFVVVVYTLYVVNFVELVFFPFRYIFGNNSSSEKISMTTPVFTQASDDSLSDVSIQIVLPHDKDLNRYILI
jgi:SOUL heme-binding protein